MLNGAIVNLHLELFGFAPISHVTCYVEVEKCKARINFSKISQGS